MLRSHAIADREHEAGYPCAPRQEDGRPQQPLQRILISIRRPLRCGKGWHVYVCMRACMPVCLFLAHLTVYTMSTSI